MPAMPSLSQITFESSSPLIEYLPGHCDSRTYHTGQTYQLIFACCLFHIAPYNIQDAFEVTKTSFLQHQNLTSFSLKSELGNIQISNNHIKILTHLKKAFGFVKYHNV